MREKKFYIYSTNKNADGAVGMVIAAVDNGSYAAVLSLPASFTEETFLARAKAIFELLNNALSK